MAVLAIIRENNSLEGRSVEFGKCYFSRKVSKLKMTELEFRKSVSYKLLVRLLACNSRSFGGPDIYGKKRVPL